MDIVPRRQSLQYRKDVTTFSWTYVFNLNRFLIHLKFSVEPIMLLNIKQKVYFNDVHIYDN